MKSKLGILDEDLDGEVDFFDYLLAEEDIEEERERMEEDIDDLEDFDI